jgi:hypothetical protein
MVLLDPKPPCIIHGTALLSPRVVSLALAHYLDPLALLARHISGDWGDIPLRHALMNEHWLSVNGRVTSLYNIDRATVVFVITDIVPKRTILLCEEEEKLLQDELKLTQ